MTPYESGLIRVLAIELAMWLKLTSYTITTSDSWHSEILISHKEGQIDFILLSPPFKFEILSWTFCCFCHFYIFREYVAGTLNKKIY